MDILIYKANEIEFKETADPSKPITKTMQEYIEKHDNDEVDAITIGFVSGVKQSEVHDLSSIKPDKIARLIIWLY
jgi:hypothetical protein